MLPFTVLLASLPLAAQGAAMPPGRLPVAVASFGAAAHGDAVYVAGGHVGRRHEHSRDNLSTAFWRVLRDGSVEALGAVPPLQGLALVAHEGRIVRVGGTMATNAAGAPCALHSTDEVAAWSVAQRCWQALPPLPEGRSSHDAAVLDGSLFVVGGWCLDGARRRFLATCWRLDLARPDGGWRAIAPLPAPRRALALGTLHGRLYAFGGLDEHGVTSTRVESYDPATDRWERATDLPEDGFGVAVAALPDRLLVSGRDGTVFGFDGSRFEPLRRLAVARFFHRIVVTDDQLVVLGGETETGHSPTIERIPLQTGRVAAATLQLAVPRVARARQAVFADRGMLAVVGGHVADDVHDFAPEAFATAGYRIDLGTGEVGDGPALPQAAQSAVPVAQRGAAVGGNGGDGDTALLLLGGFAHRDGRERSLDDVRLVEAGAVRATGARLDVPRTQFAAIAAADGVLVLGGTDYDAARDDDDAFRFPLDVVRLAPGLDGPALPTGITLPRPRRAFGAARLHDEIWLVGGMGPGFAPVAGVDVLDLATGAWRTAPAPQAPRIAPKLVAVDGALWLLGGTGPGRAPVTAIEEYEPAHGAWRAIGELPRPTQELQVVPFGGAVVVFATAPADPGVAFVDVLHGGLALRAAASAAAGAVPGSPQR